MALPSLKHSKINLKFIRSYAEIAIKNLLTTYKNENISLILDESLISLINMSQKADKLRALNVKNFSYLTSPYISAFNIFIIRPCIHNCQHIISVISNNKLCKFVVVFLPNKSLPCIKLFEQAGILDYMVIEELNINMIPLDYDLISMCYPNKLNGTFLTNIAQSLIFLQTICGGIPYIQCIGPQSKFVMNEMLQLESTYVCGNIQKMIVIDRTCDPITPLLTQSTYYGALDDMFGIKNGVINVPENTQIVFDKYVCKKDGNYTIKISSDDPVLNYVGILPLDLAYEILITEAKQFKNSFTDLKSSKLADNDILLKSIDHTNFLNHRMPRQLLETHLKLIYYLINEINKKSSIINFEENIILGIENDLLPVCSTSQILRLLYLQSVVDGTINKKHIPVALNHNGKYDIEINNFVDNIIDNIPDQKREVENKDFINKILTKELFGISENQRHVPLTSNIQPNFQNMKTTFNLLEKDFIKDEQVFDMAFTFGGVVSCRIIEKLLDKDKKLQSYKDTTLQDGFFNKINKNLKDIHTMKAHYMIREEYLHITNLTEIAIIVFVGGVTYSEICALRFLANKNGIHIIVLTTDIINGNSFIKVF